MSTATAAIYGASATKRSRSTKAEISALEAAIYEVCEAEQPLSIRAVFYRVMSKGVVPKTEASYKRIQRRVLLMRRGSDAIESWIDPEALRLTRIAEASEREGLKALATAGIMDGGAR